MQTQQRTKKNTRILPGMVCLLVCCLPGLCLAESQSQSAPSDIARQVVTFIEHGQWNLAAERLSGQDVNSLPELATLAAVLSDYQALEKKRSEQQQQIYAERCEALTGTFEQIAENDPNLSYQNAFRQMYNVWKDATEQQQAQIASTEAYQTLIAHARRVADDLYASGEWSQSYTRGIQWLLFFEPQDAASRQLDKKLAQVNAILGFLKEDSCEDKMQRYAPIQRQTIRQVFSILQTNYVNPLPFDKMASGVLNRATVLSDVLKAAPSGLVVTIDPNHVTQWADAIAAVPNDVTAETFDRRQFEAFLDLLLAVNEQTLKLPEGFVLSMMTDAALGQLDDYTTMVWPFALKDFDKAMTGQFGGIGVHIRKDREGLRILSLIPDTPAMKAGLQADTVIVAVDGESTSELSVTCAVQKISGPIGTSVILTIRSPGSEAEELVTLVRANIVIPAVEGSRQTVLKPSDEPAAVAITDPNHHPPIANQDTEAAAEDHWDYFLDDTERIGYLRLKQFTERTIPEATAALAEMESRGLAGLVLDLRGNSGGLLSAALQMADLFVNNGFLLQSRGRNDTLAAWTAAGGPERTCPMAILIDGASASASEIVAGILGVSYHRAVLVGQRSYGKGSMQEVVDLGGNKGKLKYTNAYYYLPNGLPVPNRQSVQDAGRDDWGIAPDVSVPLYDFERRRVAQAHTKRVKISNTDQDIQNQSDDSIRREMLEVDHQLAVAVLVLKAQLAAGR